LIEHSGQLLSRCLRRKRAMLDGSEYEKLLTELGALLQEEKHGSQKELGTQLHWKRMVSRPERVSQLSKRDTPFLVQTTW
jgi:hypothetical protein